jgi:hypothetical protein
LTTQPELFDVGERRAGPKKPCTPHPPGSGPAGETCGSCRHCARIRRAKTYLKCELMRFQWTSGAATDIRAKWPACKAWEPNE